MKPLEYHITQSTLIIISKKLIRDIPCHYHVINQHIFYDDIACHMLILLT